MSKFRFTKKLQEQLSAAAPFWWRSDRRAKLCPAVPGDKTHIGQDSQGENGAVLGFVGGKIGEFLPEIEGVTPR